MPKWDVHFERRRESGNRLGKVPVEAPSPEEAEEQFMDDVLLADGEFVVYDVQRAL